MDCSQTASYLREQFPNLTWVSAKIEGTQLVLAVKENVDGYVIEEKADDPQNLVAKKRRDGRAYYHTERHSAGAPR